MRIRNYEHRDANSVVSLLEASGFKRRLMDWQFNRSSGGRSLVALSTKDRIVGFNGVMPVSLSLGDHSIPAAWSCDFYVSQSFRGKGVGRELKQSLQENHKVIMAFGISDAASRVHGRLGWRPYCGSIRPVVRRNSVRRLRDVLLLGIQAFNRLIHSRFQFSTKRSTVEHYDANENILRDVADCWSAARLAWPAAVNRNFEYLRWRYLEHPTAAYRISVVRDEHRAVVAALVWRFSDEQSFIVDYIGPPGLGEQKLSLVSSVLRKLRGSASVSCTTSDNELRRAMRACGAYTPRSSRLRFSIWQHEPLQGHLADRTWLIMGGDSDGELLEAAAVNFGPRFGTVAISSNKPLREQWASLLEDSDADALFGDHRWLSAWWDTFSQEHELEDRSLAMFDEDDRLVGVLPLFGYVAHLRFPIKVHRLQFIGGTWQGPEAMRSEYLKPIVRHGDGLTFLHECEEYLRGMKQWDDLVLPDVPADSDLLHQITTCFSRLGLIRQPRYYRDTSYQIDCTGDFKGYKDALSQSARRRLFASERRFVRDHGEYVLEHASTSRINEFLDDLNQLHETRWGRPVFEGARYAFIRRISQSFSETGALHLSRISFKGKPLSVLLNIEAERTLYNIQAGFDESFDPKIPLGYMHLGLQIRSCFQSDLASFDLLAGKGKNTDFKRQFSKADRDLTVLQVVRASWLKSIYRARDQVFRSGV